MAQFNPETGYYETSSGRRIRDDDMAAWIEDVLDAGDAEILELANAFLANDMTREQFADGMDTEIRNAFITLYLLGRGGQGQMTPADYVMLAAMIDQQEQYLDRLLSDYANGEISEAQALARLRMYGRAARSAFEQARSALARTLGNNEEMWHIGPVRTEHCDDCIRYAGMGWQPIGAFPMPGSGGTACLSNCRCHKTYRNSATGATYGE